MATFSIFMKLVIGLVLMEKAGIVKCDAELKGCASRYMQDWQIRQNEAISYGVPFVVALARRLLLQCHYQCTPGELASLLHQRLPDLGRPFLRRLIDLLIGDKPECHPFTLDDWGRVRLLR